MKKRFYSKEESDSKEHSRNTSLYEERHNECVLMDFESKYESELEDYEGELTNALDEMKKDKN